MGSWNATCFITHAPIQSGDPIVAVMLAETTRKGPSGSRPSAHYPSSHWHPISVGFHGVYDGYGRVESDEVRAAPGLRALVEALTGHATVEKKERPRDEPKKPGEPAETEPFNPELASLLGIQKLVHDERMVLIGHAYFHPDRMVRPAFALAHAAAWDAMLEAVDDPYEDVVTPDVYMQTSSQVLEAAAARNTTSARREVSEEDLEGTGWDAILRRDGGICGYGTPVRMASAITTAMFMAKNGDMDGSYTLMKGIADILTVGSNLGMATRFWFPAMSGGGEGDHVWEIHERIARVTLALAAADQNPED